jgi:quercetin dioxygenase-like cupin family protein
MARRTVVSAATGETFVFDDAWNEPDGRVRRLEYRIEPGKKVPLHCHPGAAQTFEVVSGVLHVRVGGKVRALKAGERAATAVGDVHTQWNEGPAATVAVETYEPAIAIEPFFTVLPHAIASANPFKIAVFFADFQTVSAASGPAQWFLIACVAPLGRLFGLTRWYEPLLPKRG